ncbi:MAG: 4Fe-4S binding protein [Chloroflexi bacterium]|nr:4Fe-4S binding protein [Chloroflexota bacterium]
MQSVSSAAGQARRLLPTFSADANSFGRLVGQDGQVLPQQNAVPTPAPAGKHRWVMVIDLARCDGCHLCTEACNSMHKAPEGEEWIRVFKMQDSRTNATFWFPKPCFQCDNSPCTKVCPVGATYKREDGVVLIDQDRCIGCRYCIAACPYSSRFFTWVEPVQTPEERALPYDVEMNTPHRRGVAEKLSPPGSKSPKRQDKTPHTGQVDNLQHRGAAHGRSIHASGVRRTGTSDRR